MYRSSPFPSTLNSNVITALGMCKVCTEAVHSVALWTRTFWFQQALIHSQKHENAKTRKRENRESAKTAKTAKTRKRRKRENTKTAKARKRRKRRRRENGENAKKRKRRKRENRESAKTAKTAKTRKRRKRENGESRKAVQKAIQPIKLAIKDARRWEQRETRKRENGKKCSRFLVFWFSRFLVFSFRWLHLSGQVAFFMCLEFLHMERKTTSLVHPHPPSQHISKHPPGWTRVMFSTRRMQTQLSAFASMLPRCTAHMLKTISLHFSRMNLNGCRFWDRPIAQHVSAFGALDHLQASNKHSVVCHLWHPNLLVRSNTRFEELWVTNWANLHTCWMLPYLREKDTWEKCGGKMETQSAPKRRRRF